MIDWLVEWLGSVEFWVAAAVLVWLLLAIVVTCNRNKEKTGR